MPITIATRQATGNQYGAPFVGEAEYPVAVPVLVSGLTTAEVDAKGFIKPGVPLTKTGTLVGAAGVVFGVVPEAIKIAATNASADLTAAGTVNVAVIVIGVVNRTIIEQNLGRVLNANELAGFALAGSLVKLAN